MRILLDVDDVLLDLLPAWIQLYNDEADDDLDYREIRSWDLRNYVRDGWGDSIYDLLTVPHLYDSVQPIPEALSGVKKLRELGHDIVFVTALHHPGKLERLKMFGFVEDSTDYVVSKNKGHVRGDVLVDDYVKNLLKFDGHRILFTRRHNAAESDGAFIRADNWASVVYNIRMLETQAVVAGLSKTEPIITGESGGKQSALRYDFTLFDPLALFSVANVLHEGAERYGRWNWRRITLNDNLNHALSHIFAYLAGDRQDDHLSHAACRLLFALSLHITPGESEFMKPETK